MTNDRGMIAEYNGYLKKEIDLIRPMISNDREGFADALGRRNAVVS